MPGKYRFAENTTKSYQKNNDYVACDNGDSEGVSTMELKGISGCRVTLEFASKPDSQLQIDIARMLIDSFVKRRSNE